MTAPLADSAIGLVTCLYRAESSDWPSRWEALGIATDFAPSTLVAPMVGVSEFGLGSTLAFRREDLQQIGGFGSIADYIADDYQLGARIHRPRPQECDLAHGSEHPALGWLVARCFQASTALGAHDSPFPLQRLSRIAGYVCDPVGCHRGDLRTRGKRAGAAHGPPGGGVDRRMVCPSESGCVALFVAGPFSRFVGSGGVGFCPFWAHGGMAGETAAAGRPGKNRLAAAADFENRPRYVRSLRRQ